MCIVFSQKRGDARHTTLLPGVLADLILPPWYWMQISFTIGLMGGNSPLDSALGTARLQ
jgi:hypothetical protein